MDETDYKPEFFCAKTQTDGQGPQNTQGWQKHWCAYEEWTWCLNKSMTLKTGGMGAPQ
jgi:hypothetical protein